MRCRSAAFVVAVIAVVFATLASSAAAAAADPVADVVAAVVPDPSPSLRGVGNTLYTTLKSNATARPFFGTATNGTSAIKGALSLGKG